MAYVGMESGPHVFFALLAMLVAALTLGMVYRNGNTSRTRQLALILAILVWLSWISIAPVYMYEYGTDKAVIKSNPETAAAHSIGMETKEHVFYTGLILATLVPMIAYGTNGESGRRLLLAVLVLIIVGGIILDAYGAWIQTSAKIAYALRGG